jgi:hypothetical protein
MYPTRITFVGHVSLFFFKKNKTKKKRITYLPSTPYYVLYALLLYFFYLFILPYIFSLSFLSFSSSSFIFKIIF